jgi:hypothetical protein
MYGCCAYYGYVTYSLDLPTLFFSLRNCGVERVTLSAPKASSLQPPATSHRASTRGPCGGQSGSDQTRPDQIRSEKEAGSRE